MGHFLKKTAIITGASRGIGREMALKLAKEGANIVLAAKSTEDHPSLPGTIASVAEEVRQRGGQALPFKIDVRDSEAIDALVDESVKHFGRLDILINNAGAIYLTDTLSTPAKQFDLMHSINVRATFLLSRAVAPYLKQHGGHILNMSPPIDLNAKWLAPHVAYTMSKYGMSLCTLAMAQEFGEYGIAVNSLWPKTLIYTAAIKRLLGDESAKNCRTPAIVADAALWILSRDPKEISGHLFLDEEVLTKAGQKDLSMYNCTANPEILPDLFVDSSPKLTSSL